MIYPVAVLCLCSILIAVLNKSVKLPDYITKSIVILSLLISLSQIPTINPDISTFFAYLFLIFSTIVAVYSFSFNYSPSFYILLLFSVAGLVGLTLTQDLFTFFVFWELMVLPSYILVTLNAKAEAIEAALKYMILSVLGSVLILFGIGLFYGLSGSLEISPITGNHIWLVIVFMFAGFGVKAGVFPFNLWMPDVYQTTSESVASFFSSVMSKAGILALIKLIYMLVPSSDFTVLALFAIVGMTVSNLAALLQTNLKRLFAYSSISHLNYILLAISLANSSGLQAGLFHSINHAIAKALLFFCVGIFGKNELKNLKGVASSHPFIGICFILGLLSAIGIPPTNTFMSEFQIVLAVLESSPLLALILAANIVISSVYYIRIIQYTVLEKGSKYKLKISTFASILIFLLSISILVIGIYPSFLVDIIKNVVIEVP